MQPRRRIVHWLVSSEHSRHRSDPHIEALSVVILWVQIFNLVNTLSTAVWILGLLQWNVGSFLGLFTRWLVFFFITLIFDIFAKHTDEFLPVLLDVKSVLSTEAQLKKKVVNWLLGHADLMGGTFESVTNELHLFDKDASIQASPCGDLANHFWDGLLLLPYLFQPSIL